MKRITRGWALLVLCAAVAQGASGGESTETEQQLDTVVVEGTQARLNKILQEMVQSEDRFYERYNELNTNDDFDMMCFRGTQAGTRMKRRYCIAVYVNNAMQRFGQDYAEFFKENLNAGGGTSYNPTNDPPPLRGIMPAPPNIMIEARRKDFKQNMRDVVKRNPELIEMLRERDELGKQYEATRRMIWGLKPPPEDKGASPASSGAP